jgi:hypothetical protein
MKARYNGLCVECGEPIHVGDEIVCRAWFPGLVPFAHETCPKPLRGKVCEQCFLERSLTGECGCDE